jgi:hypothetical protein
MDMWSCPKCGYREKVDWPAILWAVAFTVLYLVFRVTSDHLAKSYRVVGLAAYLLFWVGNVWKYFKSKKDHDEYLKLNPSVTEGVKAHIRPTSQ